MPFTNRLNIEELILFDEVARKGSFSAAGATFDLSPSAVSRAISRLEDKVGVQLLKRSTRQLSLTAEGEILHAGVPRLLDHLQTLETQLTERRSAITGTLTVSVGTAMAETRLTPALPAFLAQHPELRLDLNVTDRRVNLLRERIDVAIRTGPLADTSLIARRVGTGRRLVCASPDYLARHGRPETPEDLANHRCLTISGHETLERWPFHAEGTVVPLQVQPHMQSDSAVLLRNLAVAGLGIVRLADFVVADAVEAGRLVPLLEDRHHAEDFPIWAIYPPAERVPPRLRAFVDFVASDVLGRRRADAAQPKAG
jgi:DNA-binding transcriptional LysR family regulator